MSSTARAGMSAAERSDLERLSGIVMDLAEVVERLTHDDDVLAVPEGRVEAERLAREARRLMTRDITAASPVKLLAERRPVQISVTGTIREVTHILAREGIGAVVVEGTLATAGIITERDVVRALAAGANPDTELAAHWMRGPLVSVDPKDTILSAGRAMAAHHVRHLVLADGDQVTGVVSARDILAQLASEVGRS